MEDHTDVPDDVLSVTISYVKTTQRTMRTLLHLLRQLEAELEAKDKERRQ